MINGNWLNLVLMYIQYDTRGYNWQVILPTILHFMGGCLTNLT